MERMMPLDLEKAQLRTTFRGYDRMQVQALLQRAAKEMATLRSELDSLKNEISKQRQDLEGFRTQENTLKEALVLAQRTADETRATAHKEADVILEQARQKASGTEAQMQSNINDLRWELEKLRLERQRFLGTYRAMLETQLRDIAEMGGLAVVEGELTQTAEA